MFRTLLAAFLAALLAAPGALRYASTDGTCREDPVGMKRWLAMPFRLMLWLLLSPLVFFVATQGTPKGACPARTAIRPDGQLATTVP